jgi:hypothetical protein
MQRPFSYDVEPWTIDQFALDEVEEVEPSWAVIDALAEAQRVLDVHASNCSTSPPLVEGCRAVEEVGKFSPSSSKRKPCPSPCATSNRSNAEEPEIRGMIRDFRTNNLKPLPVERPELPANTPDLERRIYEDMCLRMGLRLARSENRSLPYATSEAVWAGLTTDRRHASRARQWLIDHDLIHQDEDARCADGKPMRTRCYLPGPAGGWDVVAPG